jgi:hypothetical protein
MRNLFMRVGVVSVFIIAVHMPLAIADQCAGYDRDALVRTMANPNVTPEARQFAQSMLTLCAMGWGQQPVPQGGVAQGGAGPAPPRTNSLGGRKAEKPADYRTASVGSVRSVTAIVALEHHCVSYFKINTDLATRMVSAFSNIGARVMGVSEFENALEQDLPRRLEEVQNTGEEKWCRAKKANYLKVNSGLRDLFPE